MPVRKIVYLPGPEIFRWLTWLLPKEVLKGLASGGSN